MIFLESSNIYFVYCFLDTRKPGEYVYGDVKFDYEPIYIGKGKGWRPKKHFTLYKKVNNRFYSKMMSIMKSGSIPSFVNILDGLSESESLFYEKFFIKIIGRIENGGPLTNLTDGGEGVSGFKFSDESRRKMSDARIGKQLGPMSDETKLRISLSKIGKVSYRKGKKLEEIFGVEKSASIRNRLSEIAKNKIGNKNPMFGKKHSSESKEKMSNNTVKKFAEDNPMFGKERKESEKVFDTWELTKENGDVIVIDNLVKFCRDNRLNPSCMRDILYGRMKRHKGWIKVVKLTNNVKKKKMD